MIEECRRRTHVVGDLERDVRGARATCLAAQAAEQVNQSTDVLVRGPEEPERASVGGEAAIRVRHRDAGIVEPCERAMQAGIQARRKRELRHPARVQER